VKILDALATAVAFILEQIHRGLSTFLPDASGWAWGLSIVLLTMTVRILLFPLFVKQIKSQRRMQEIAPKVKELQAKHKGDRETLNQELMKLYKDHGTNPISGCLPLILQLPIFFALFRVMNEVKPHGDGTFHGKYGLSDKLVEQAAHAKIFGAPIAAAFNSSASFLDRLGQASGTSVSSTNVKVVAAVMVVIMGLTTFLTQRQMMARTGGQLDPQQAQVQKILLYVLPLSFGVFGFSFPIGVLLYWLTTNVWSMGQQRWVIARMPPVQPGGSTGKGGKGGPGGGGGNGPREPRRPKPSGGGASEEAESPVVSVPEQASAAEGDRAPASRPAPPRPGGARAAGSRKNKKRKGGRR
jgi:YidC/Oxa1 family membrane protein insertase